MAEEKPDKSEAEKLAQLKEQFLEPKKMVKSDDGKEYPLCIAEVEFKRVRNKVAAMLRVLDPEAHAKYKSMKSEDGGSLAARRNAYVFAFTRVAQLAYNISGL